MNVRSPNVPPLEGDTGLLGAQIGKEVTLPHHRDIDVNRKPLNLDLVPSPKGRRTSQTILILILNKSPTKKKSRETFKEESSWLVYSSDSNHELLLVFFSVFQGFRPASQTDFPHSYEQSASECFV